jgi:alanyl-tRNA synthetase
MIFDDELYDEFARIEKSLEKEQEEFWNSLSKEDQLKAFCAVMRRLVQGELVDQRSYRGVLYDTFGFGLESYLQAQLAGYMAIHNSIVPKEKVGTSPTSLDSV